MSTLPEGARVELQIAAGEAGELPAEEEFSSWVNAALTASNAEFAQSACVTIRIVDSGESSRLNAGFRDIDKPTNVLAFPAGAPVVPVLQEEQELGDLVICHEVVEREAGEQGKTITAHLAHLTVHGTLHLVGYDHHEDAEAGRMEALETDVITNMGFADPYDHDAQDEALGTDRTQ